MGSSSTSLGRWGEDLAAAHLQAIGLHVLSRGWRPHAQGVRGELDLVAREGRTVVFVEVKTRSGPWFTPLEAVTATKQHRIRRLAVAWLAVHHAAPGERPADLRFDVVAVSRVRGRAVVQHVPAAF